ncbi:MAG TPA: DNA-binding protein [Candidatus Ozemobacteraceae bacterium]|nr:DNA-binding protein [Candidatus Ozemobacteraceae bacterium]
MKAWFSASELLGLPGMLQTVQSINRCAKNAAWEKRPRQAQGGGFEYHISSLPPETQAALIKKHTVQAQQPEPIINITPAADEPTAQDFADCIPNTIETDAAAYDHAPDHSRRKADKYLTILTACEGLFGRDLITFVEAWNREHPRMLTSYPSILRARKTREAAGVGGLLGRWGKSQGVTKVSPDLLEYFAKHYLQESRPSLEVTWKRTLGLALREKPGTTAETFPSVSAFYRAIQNQYDKSVIYMARYGQQAWNRRYAAYIERDYSTLPAGECWVSDHAQIDVLVNAGDKIVAPWITAWRDLKTGKFLGWYIHAEAPNSDHIFQAFYVAAMQYGLPKHVLIDNGKDYRCKDFAGGRSITRQHKVNIDPEKARPMLLLLGIEPHFALPYNAQTKPIERDFLKIKEWFSKAHVGYRGGDVIERPERLAAEVKAGSLIDFEQLEAGLGRFIIEILNKTVSEGKALRGRFPDQAWAEEFKTRREVRRDALMLFCMRTSENYTIGRNGIRDSKLGISYWGEWMSGRKGDLVYMRRDPKAFQDAWVFDAATNAYIGQGALVPVVPVLAQTDVERQTLQKESNRKNRDRKIAKQKVQQLTASPAAEQQFYLETATAALAASAMQRSTACGCVAAPPSMPAPAPVSVIVNTSMDQVVIERQKRDQEGKADLGNLVRLPAPKKKIYGFVSDMHQDELDNKKKNQEEHRS